MNSLRKRVNINTAQNMGMSAARGTAGNEATVAGYWPDPERNKSGEMRAGDNMPQAVETSPMNRCIALEVWNQNRDDFTSRHASRALQNRQNPGEPSSAVSSSAGADSTHSNKRHRGPPSAGGDNSDGPVQKSSRIQGRGPRLLSLSEDLIINKILSQLDSVSLGRIGATCRKLKSMVHPSAQFALQQPSHKEDKADQWSRNISPLSRLQLSEAFCGFKESSGRGALTFKKTSDDPYITTEINLQGNGPILLLSDRSTREKPLLRWRVQVLGNTAIEFGVIPVDNLTPNDDGQGTSDSPYRGYGRYPSPEHQLHKAQLVAARSGARTQAQGFASSNTHGSELAGSIKVLMGSTVEVIASAHAAEYRVTHPDGATEMVWHDLLYEGRPFTGPKESILTHSFSNREDVRLGCTLWARGHIRVLHPGTTSDAGSSSARTT